MTVIVNNLAYAPSAGPSDTLIVQQTVGGLPVAATRNAIGLVTGFADTGSNNVDLLQGCTITASKQGAGGANSVEGLVITAEASSSANVGVAVGLRARVKATNGATITSAGAILAQSPGLATGGTITGTPVGVQIDPQTVSGVSQGWGLYCVGPSDINGIAGTLSVGSLGGGGPYAALDVTGAIRSVPVTVATLPASPVDGSRAFVTDATSTTFAAAVAGSGSNHVPVYYDGGSSAWRIG